MEITTIQQTLTHSAVFAHRFIFNFNEFEVWTQNLFKSVKSVKQAVAGSPP